MGGVFHDDQQSGSICACAQKVDNVLMLSYVDKNLELWSEVSVLLFSGIGWNFEVNRQKKSLVIRRLFIMVNHPTASSPQPNIIITIENVTSKCNDFSRDSKTCVPIILELNTSYQQFEARNVSKLRIASIYGPNERQKGHDLKWEKKQVDVTNSTNRESEFSKMFVISLRNWIEVGSTPRNQVVPTLE